MIFFKKSVDKSGKTCYNNIRCETQKQQKRNTLRVEFNGRIPAFQAGYVGSIPITRSNFSKCAFNSAG